MMYLSRLRLDPAAVVRSGLREAMGSGLYDTHRLLWRLFADRPDRERDFLYRDMGGGFFLAVSARLPQDPDGVWEMATKEYSPVLAVGDRLLFTLRANAVRKTRDAAGRQERHSVVEDLHRERAAELAASAGATAGGERAGHAGRRRPPSREALALEAGGRWLAARAADLGLAVEQESLLVESYARHSFRHRAGGKAALAVLDLRGFARVTDPAKALAALYRGVGPAKAFGCGLLLVRRA
ncbi:MAG: type I-E CRISPR-associated protein Cas6/Cse3/CasE [Thermodesulfobacteriota bacterium]